MNLIYDSGILEYGNHSRSDVKQIKHYIIDGQLFSIEVTSGSNKNYRIYRFSESGKWEWMEAEGDSFPNTPDIRYLASVHSDGVRTPATWDKWWDKLETRAQIYANVTKPYRGKAPKIPKGDFE